MEGEVGFTRPDPAVAPGRLGPDPAIGPSPGGVGTRSASLRVGNEIDETPGSSKGPIPGIARTGSTPRGGSGANGAGGARGRTVPATRDIENPLSREGGWTTVVAIEFILGGVGVGRILLMGGRRGFIVGSRAGRGGMLLTEIRDSGVLIRFVSGRIGKGGMLLKDGGDKGGIPGSPSELMIGKVGNSVTEKVCGGRDTGGTESPLAIVSVGKGAICGVAGKGRRLLMEGSDNGGIGIALMIGSVGKGPISGAVGKGRTLMVEGGGKVGIGSSASVGSANIGLPVGVGSKRPSERRKQMRSSQPNGRLVAAVEAGASKRLNERTTQNRESHLREDAETGNMADGDGVIRVFNVPELPSPLRVGFKVQSGSQSGQRFGSKETSGGGGNHCGEGNPGGGGCHGQLGLRGGSGAGSFHGLLGFKSGSGGGGIQGL